MLGILHCFPALEHAVLNLCPLLLQPHTSIPPILPKWLCHNFGDIGTPCYNCYDFFICLVFCALITHFFQPQTLPIVPGFLNTFIHIRLSINFIILKEVSPGTFWHFQTGRAALCSWHSRISPPSTSHPCCPAPISLRIPSPLFWAGIPASWIPRLPVSCFAPHFSGEHPLSVSWERVGGRYLSRVLVCLRISLHFWCGLEL